MRNFDSHKQFEDIKKAALAALQKVFPVEGKRRAIRLDKSWVDDKADSSDYLDQAETKVKEGTWGA